MMTYLVLHGFVSLLVLASLKLIASAPPRLRLWLAVAGMALWLVPMPLYRPTVNLAKMPEPLITTIRVFETAYTPSKSQGPIAEAPVNRVNDLPWLTLIIMGIFAMGLLKWAWTLRQHRQWMGQLNRKSRRLVDNSPTLAWGITAPIWVMPGYGAMTTGFLRPKIWIGSEHLGEPELASLLLHEWQHIQQGDNLWTSHIHFLECLFWWNPLVRYLGRQARFFIELSCDQKCIRIIDHRIYQRALARTLQRKIMHPFPTADLVTAAQGPANTNISRLKSMNRRFHMNLRQIMYLMVTFAIGSVAIALPSTSPQALLPTINTLQINDETPPADTIARVGQTGVTPPVFTKKVSPVYPERAKKIKLQGYVIMEAVLRKDGTVTDMKVLRGLGKGVFGFEDASMEALEKWQFKPGKVNGVAADVRMTLKIDFVLQDDHERLTILKWNSPDGPSDAEYKRPVAKIASHAKKKKGSAPNLVIPVEVEIDAAGNLVDFEADSAVLGQLLYPDLALEQLKSLMADIEWTPAKADDQAYATVMTLNLDIHLGAIDENR